MRDALCLKCLDAAQRDAFSDDAKTSPNIVPISARTATAAQESR